MPLISLDLAQSVAFCTEYAEAMGPAKPPLGSGGVSAHLGGVSVFGAEEKSGDPARAALGHQRLTGARFITGFHH